VRGGVSPLGLKKPAPVFLDELAWLFDQISISPGQRGLQVLLHPDDLLRVSQAKMGSLCRY
jgi:Cys-tRNA(Pro)/Cys-tRNA(Cys) deacylase